MRDGSGQATDSSEPILDANFAFQTANGGKVIQAVDEAQKPSFWDGEAGDADAKGTAKSVNSDEPHFIMGAVMADVRQGIEEQFSDGLAEQLSFAVVQQLFTRAVH